MADIDALFKQLGGDSDSSLGDDDSFANDQIPIGSGHRSVASSVTHDSQSISPGDFLHGHDDDDSESSTNTRDLERQAAASKEQPELGEIRKLASNETRNVKLWRSIVVLVVRTT